MPNSSKPEFSRRLWLTVLALVLAIGLWVVRDALLLGFAAIPRGAEQSRLHIVQR
ncbi:MAG: hypothetical protein IPO30_13890 [Hyphomonadaceae bacterium]|nr:hypothetical protein [Hyphomonadaceae bacterium]MBP9233257.1 hypothetical protein [Hyphomonadaceae bacterium]